MKKPRINIEVDELLKHEAKMKALKQKKTLTEVIVKYLTKWIKN